MKDNFKNAVESATKIYGKEFGTKFETLGKDLSDEQMAITVDLIDDAMSELQRCVVLLELGAIKKGTEIEFITGLKEPLTSGLDNATEELNLNDNQKNIFWLFINNLLDGLIEKASGTDANA